LGLLLAVLSFLGAEIILRLNNVRPWQPEPVEVKVEPGMRFFRADPVLGYTHLPGRFEVTLETTDHTFVVNHDEDGLRFTGPDSKPMPSDAPEIWILGCSFTHGWSLDDAETYPWLVQNAYPDYRVVNFGTSGYGTIHALLQMEAALKESKPAVIVYAYAGFHDTRNTFARVRRKAIAPWNRLGPLIQPYARFNRADHLEFSRAEVVYEPLPGMRHSALLHFIEMKYNQFELTGLESRKVSISLIQRMHAEAAEAGVPFLFAEIQDGAEVRTRIDEEGIPTLDLSVDLSQPGFRNLPHDFHPSKRAHQAYAEKLTASLSRYLN